MLAVALAPTLAPAASFAAGTTDAPASTSSVPAASTSSPSPAASVLTADAVQEAFVRVSNRVRASVVSIEASRNPRESKKAEPKSDKPGPGSGPGSKAAPKADPKADPKGAPKPNPKGAPREAPDDESESEEDGEEERDPFEMPFPFGPRDPRERPRAMGTGMVISRDGFILTNYHVVRGASFIRVLFDPDSESPDNPSAKLIGYDEEADLAVLKLLRNKENLQPVEFADSDAVRIGEWALAVGAPFEQAQSVTVGVVSAKARHLEKRGGQASLQDYIQTDASINPGNSGGPLFNLDGKVIGINTAILSPSRFNVGIGFSVPANTIKAFLPTLLSGRPIERGFIGINYMKLNPGVAKEFGIESGMHIGGLAVDEKTGQPSGPAQEAGLRVDDIITHIEGKPVASVEEFRRLISSRRPGASLALRIARPHETGVEMKDIALKLGTRPGSKQVFPALPTSANASALGLEVQDAAKLSPEDREILRYDPGTRGAIVTDVVPGSPADEGEVRRGLRIVRARVNGGAWQNIGTKATFDKLEQSLAPGARVLLQLRDRDEVSVYNVVVAPDKKAGNVS
jgi:serine protease Do